MSPSDLDVHLRQQLREEVQAILVQAGITTILVTHDQEEALSFADTLAVIDQGQVVQYAPPDEVVRRPRTRFVAQFIGQDISSEVKSMRPVSPLNWAKSPTHLPEA